MCVTREGARDAWWPRPLGDWRQTRDELYLSGLVREGHGEAQAHGEAQESAAKLTKSRLQTAPRQLFISAEPTDTGLFQEEERRKQKEEAREEASERAREGGGRREKPE